MADNSVLRGILCNPSNLEKTPLTIINEVASTMHAQPDIRIEENFQSLSLKKSYQCTVRVCSNLVGRGTGSNKRDAKQRASQNALEQLTTMINLKSHQVILPPCLNAITGSTDTENGSGNPIGELQELGSQRQEHPVYRLADDRGHNIEKRFTMEVMFAGQRCEGTGRSKKVAKRIAAENMLKLVKGDPSSLARCPVNMNSHTGTKVVDEYGLYMRPPLSSNFFDLLDKHGCLGFPKNLRSPGSYVPRYVEEDFIIPLQKWKETENNSRQIDTRAVKQLEEKTRQLGVTLKYHRIPELTKSKEFQCFVEVLCDPICVQLGQGQTAELAKADAAKNAMDYLNAVESEQH